MAANYDDAISALYQAAHGSFVAERKRLAAELKASGDPSGAGRLAKLVRPPISVWVVNQLWWRERESFEALFATAERLQRGDRSATDSHREASAALRSRAAKLLNEAGHASSEATLRRVTATLAALAASGGFAPEPAGALSADRDPPGFEAWGIGNALPEEETTGDDGESEKPEPKASRTRESDAEAKAKAEALAKGKAEAKARAEAEAKAAAERRQEEQRRAAEQAERRRLEAALRDARRELEPRARDAERLRKELATAEASLARVESTIRNLEAELAALVPEA